MGNTNLIKNIVKAFDLKVKIYPNRNDPNNARIYLDLEDDFVKDKLSKTEKIIRKNWID